MKSRKLIEHLFKQGRSFAHFPYRVYYSIGSVEEGKEDQQLLFGVGVSTRNFKKAVDRNRVKRLSREAWRLQKKELQKKLAEQNRQWSVFFIYTGKELPVYQDLYEKTSAILKKLMDIADK